ncbi:hypothetical protein Y032_0171g295 [Ancylostoma ceylanicum]|uniref:Uncharacterized protein n=1 Tax=Ancylostoma ceylanicum TaxID=53326 RepID=A0A016SVL5_9BILA|nr:hypothetical protein Y032_0171g295 [Ancylostoma ceylanicum]
MATPPSILSFPVRTYVIHVKCLGGAASRLLSGSSKRTTIESRSTQQQKCPEAQFRRKNVYHIELYSEYNTSITRHERVTHVAGLLLSDDAAPKRRVRSDRIVQTVIRPYKVARQQQRVSKCSECRRSRIIAVSLEQK